MTMLDKPNAYDHPKHRVPLVISFSGVAGANGVQLRYPVLFAMKVRAVVSRTAVAGTSAAAGHQHLIRKISGTTTTSIGANALNTIAANNTVSSELSVSFAAGDELHILNGTDATGVASCAVEAYLTPGALTSGP